MARTLPNFKTQLKDEVISRLKNRPVWLELKEVELNTGIGVEWLKALLKGRIHDPGVCRVQTILAFLDVRIPK